MPNRLTPPDTDATSPLEGWKAIATYLNRDVRTAKRWEASEGLPIHRHRHLARSSVYAQPAELDAWRLNRRPEGKGASAWQLKRNRWLTLVPLAVAVLMTTGGGRAAAPPVPDTRQNVSDVQLWSED